MATKKTLANFGFSIFEPLVVGKFQNGIWFVNTTFRVQTLDNAGPIMNLVERVQKRDPKSFYSHKFLWLSVQASSFDEILQFTWPH